MFCILPKKYKDLKDQLDLDGDGIISEDEFKQISQFLINESIKGLLFEIIICSKDKDKSIRTFNILKTLVDNGVSVLWNDDDDIIKNESYFLISDKTIIINKNYFLILTREKQPSIFTKKYILEVLKGKLGFNNT